MEVSHAYLVLLFRKPTGTYQALSVFRVDGRRVVNGIIYVINTDFSGRRLLLSTARTRPCTIGFSGGANSVLQQSLHRAGESDAF